VVAEPLTGPGLEEEAGKGKGMSKGDGVGGELEGLADLEKRNMDLRNELQGYRKVLKQSLASGPQVPSHIARMGMNKFTTVTMLEKQLGAAMKRISIYKQANEALKQRVDKLSDKDLTSRLERKVRDKEARIAELTDERRALLNIRRSFEKQLVREQDARDHLPETISSLQKDVRVYQFKLRRLKAFIDTLRQRQRDQAEQLQALTNQNRELLEKAHLPPDIVDEDVMADPAKLLSKRKRRMAALDKVEGQKKSLQEEVAKLQRCLRQNKRSAEQEVRSLRRELEAAKEERTRLGAVFEVKEKEARLQLLQTKILKRTLRGEGHRTTHTG
jgi:DNA repair exonuclease SbcCD ATPase subunit